VPGALPGGHLPRPARVGRARARWFERLPTSVRVHPSKRTANKIQTELYLPPRSGPPRFPAIFFFIAGESVGIQAMFVSPGADRLYRRSARVAAGNQAWLKHGLPPMTRVGVPLHLGFLDPGRRFFSARYSRGSETGNSFPAARAAGPHWARCPVWAPQAVCGAALPRWGGLRALISSLDFQRAKFRNGDFPRTATSPRGTSRTSRRYPAHIRGTVRAGSRSLYGACHFRPTATNTDRPVRGQ